MTLAQRGKAMAGLETLDGCPVNVGDFDAGGKGMLLLGDGAMELNEAVKLGVIYFSFGHGE